MPRVALVSSEPLRPRMAGIGIRYFEMARHLVAEGFDVVLVSPGASEDLEAVAAATGGEARLFERGALAHALGDCEAVVAQGQLANDVVLEVADTPVVIDLYDPWLVENLHYAESLGLDPYRNDHATWMLQLSRGDFFLCSCDEQRLYYLGLLTALGRINPVRVASDPSAEGLLRVCPFGVAQELPPHEPWLEPSDVPRLLFGGLYDWYDPLCVLEALAELEDLDWQLLFVRNPNVGETPQKRLEEVEAFARRRGWIGSRVELIDWVPFERRYDLLRDVRLLVTTHLPSIETDLSLRTRFLDALAARVPALTSNGGAMSRLLREHEAGWVVPPGDRAAVAAAIRDVLQGGAEVAARLDAGRALATQFSWAASLAPLVDFCRAPRIDASKADFAQGFETRAPQDRLAFRVRRKWKSLGGGV